MSLHLMNGLQVAGFNADYRPESASASGRRATSEGQPAGIGGNQVLLGRCRRPSRPERPARRGSIEASERAE
jgi:hypothetical protein